MIGSLLFLTIIVLGLYGLNEYYKIKLGIIHKKTPMAAIEALANLIEDTNMDEGRLVELGSGYGGFVLSLAKRLPEWDIVGVEQSPTPWMLANMRSIGKQAKNYRFFLNDPIVWPLKNYDIVFIHHDEKVLRVWEQSLARRLQPSTLLITLNHRLPRIAPANAIKISDGLTFYVYQKTAQQAPTPPTPEQIAEQVAAETVAAQTAPPSTTIAPQAQTARPQQAAQEMAKESPAQETIVPSN